MVPLASLWLPIVLAAVFAFLVSSILHMVLTYHRADYKQLPREAETLAGLRGAGVAPGYYVFPYCESAKSMNDPALQERYRQGPVGILAVLPNGAPNMGRHLALWFAFCLLVAVFVAYVAGRTLGAGEHYLTVFRVVGTTAFMGFGFGEITDAIWKGQPWSNTVRGLVDGLVYALVVAGTFGWLWPH